MPENTAPVRLTGGAGFHYEDQVGAWFILHMLAGCMPLGPEYGIVTSVRFQVSESGWLLDDLLVSLSDGRSEHSMPISAKSHRYVTRNGFPEEFTGLVWQQWFGSQSGPFDKQQDLLGLVIDRLADSVKDAWNDLLQQAIDADPKRIVERLNNQGQSNQVQKSLFHSLRCPSELQDLGDTDDEATVELLRRIRLIRLELREDMASETVSAIAICQLVLESGDSSEAVDLWRELVGFAAELRASGGTADLVRTLRRLCPQFRLRDYPNHERDWRQLSRVSGEAMDIIRGNINGQVFPRDKLIEQVQSKTNQTKIIALVGDSGCGKSAIAKEIATGRTSAQKCIWLTGEMLSQPDIFSLERRLGLQNPIVDIMRSVTTPQAYLVLDAVESLSTQAMDIAARLLNQLNITETDTPWRVIITSQREGWEMVLRQFQQRHFSRQLFVQQIVESPELSEIDTFLGSFHNIHLPTLSRDIRPILRNLKILDWIVIAAIGDPGVDSRGWVGTCDVIKWIWERWISHDQARHARAETLKQLGSIEGEILGSGTSINKLTDLAQRTLSDPEVSRLVKVSDEQVYFMHELTGDWARLHVLISEQGNLTFLKSKVPLPRWHRAIRLYAQSILEKGEDGLAEWQRIITTVDEARAEDVALRDLFLEAAVLAVNSSQLLEKIWPDLSCDNARLLKRLLIRFLHAATIPDPRVTTIAESKKDVGLLAAMMRVPYWPYWGAVLTFLHKHKEDLPISIQQTVAKVSCLWLEHTMPEIQPGHPWPWRKEAAEIALRMAREVQALKAEGVLLGEDSDQKTYEALLHGSPDLPNEVTQIALELSGRKEISPEIRVRAEQATERRRREREEFLKTHPENAKELARRAASCLPIGRTDWPLKEPWPDGPVRRVDGSFQKTCLSTQAITSLIKTCPEIAREVILALCIEEPKPDDPFSYHDQIMDYLGTNSALEMYPPMYFRGPFLQFLRMKPTEGLETILRLVNFATERYLESQQKWAEANGQVLKPEFLHVAVPMEERIAHWSGDQCVYGWFRNHSVRANLVVSALMACEKWLYDLIENNQDVNPWISRILEGSQSIAFAGLLVEVGKRKHDLFAGQLMPLLGVWQSYVWDHQILMSADLWGIEMTSWASWGEMFWNLVRDWHVMPHRKQELQQIAVYLLLTNKEMHLFYERAREQWSMQLEASPNNKTLKLLISRFDPINYKVSKGNDDQIYVGLEWPVELRDETDAETHESQTCIEVLGFPMMCRQILDGEQSLTLEESPDFWEKIRWIAGLDKSQYPDLEESQIANAVCGGIAVLFTAQKPWLDDNEQCLSWCLEKLASNFSSLPPRNPIDFPQSVMTRRWDCFAAEAAVALLAYDQENEFARELVAKSVTSYFYMTTLLTMRSAYLFRQELGDDFTRMHNLALLWSALRALINRGEILKADLSRWSIWYDRLIKSFILGTISTKLISWQRVETIASRFLKRMEKRYRNRDWEPVSNVTDQETFEGDVEIVHDTVELSIVDLHSINRKKSIRFPGFDIQVLQSAFSWLPKLSEARDTAERQTWIETWRELLFVVLHMVWYEQIEQIDDISGVPYEFDRGVFKGIAQLIPQMTQEESPEKFWQPILNLGPVAHYWVEDFLRDWTIYGPDAAESLSQFVTHWRSMIEYCLCSPRWSVEARAAYNLGDLYINLMGLGLGSERIGREDFAGPIGAMLDLYEQWAQNWLRVSYVLRSFAVFLTKPGSRNLLCPAIHWIKTAVENFSDYDWRGNEHGEVESLVTDALRTCWLHYRQAVQSETTLQEAFLSLLMILTNRMCPSAMELRDEVLRSLNG